MGAHTVSATTSANTTGRQNQRNRTRKDLLLAAARLSKQGQTPSLEDIAREALVSRATAYRYFPSIDALLVEAALDVAIPDADTVFADGPAGDPVARLERVDTVLHDLILANEQAMRTMLVHTLQRGMKSGDPGDIPVRQNRRLPLIEAALAPARQEFKPAALKTLSQALALIMGTEAMVVVKDVLQLSDAEARKVKRWAIRALVQAARKSA
jgi:AcrR family transcriptional regulator